MKRITSLDFLRGLAIFLTTIFHIVLNVWTDMNRDFTTLPTGLLILGVFIFIFFHWRDFFIMISAIVHWYSMSQAFKNGKSRREILLKQLIFGVILYLFGMFRNTFLNQWGIIDKWYRSGVWDWQELSFIYFFDVLNIIAVGIIFSALVFYFMTMKKNWLKIRLNSLLLIGGIAFFYFLSPLIHNFVTQWAGSDLHIDPNFYYPPSDQRFVRFIQVMLDGREAPIFPTLGVICMGMLIGYLLVTEQLTKKNLRYFYLAGGILIGIGIGFLFFIEGGIAGINVNFFVEPVWFICINSALQMMVIIFMFSLVEFNPRLKVQSWLKGTRFFRRWSLVSLTIYAFQIFELIPREFMTLITKIDYHTRYQANGWQTLLMVFVVIGFWEILLRLWERAKFIGTWEWIILFLSHLVGKRPMDHQDPLRIKEIIYDVEIVQFLPKLNVNSLPDNIS